MKKSKYIFYIFLGFLLICKLAYWLYAFPNADEAYYWLWGRYPALSYHDHPALQSLIQSIFYELFGKYLFVLRLPAFICSVVCVLVYYNILKKLNYVIDAPIIILTFFSIPLIFLFTSFAWPDYIMITMSLCSGYFWISYLTDKWDNKKGKSWDIFLGCIFLGLAALSKYNSVFIALGILSVIILNKRLHLVLKDFRIYIGLALCLLIISPIFIWNMQNAYRSFQFTLEQRTLTPLLEGNFLKGNFLGFILGNIVLVSPFIWWAIIKNRKSFQHNDTDTLDSYSIVYRKLAKHIFLWSSITFLLLSTFSNVLYYWNIPAYIFLLPLAIIFLIEKKRKKWVFITTLIYSAFINISVVIHFAVIPLNSFIDGAEDRDGSYQYGWEVIGSKIDSITDKNYEKTQILTSSYRTASLLSFQLDRKNIYSYSPSFDQFDYWTKKLTYHRRNAIILTDDWKPINPQLKDVLKNITILDTIHIKKWGYSIKDYYIYTALIKDKYMK